MLKCLTVLLILAVIYIIYRVIVRLDNKINSWIENIKNWPPK
jgi:hypothetical protein